MTTTVSSPVEQRCLHEMIAEQAKRTPDALAVVCENQSITYRDLDSRANQLSHHLRALGVGPEVLVGMYLDRSVDAFISLLSILKAGGAYVPLDASNPKERLSYILHDAQPKVIITQGVLREALPAVDAVVTCIDADWPAICQYPQRNPRASVHANNSAYVIYTSGSTGNPKGVVIQHRGLSNLAGVLARVFDICQGTRVLQFHRLIFDYSVWDIALALPSGGTLYVTGQRVSGFDLPRFLIENKICTVSLTSSALQFLDGYAFPDLRTLITGADFCSSEVARQWSARCRFFHGYGPTEATVATTLAEYDGSGSLNIGKAIANVGVHILDSDLQQMAVGVPGELYISGIGVARGYLRRPDLTAEFFIPSPFGDGERLYRTGDIGCWLPDGNIHFIGRRDKQIKVLGHRIELGDIESALLACRGIIQAIVLPDGDRNHPKRLVAYIVGHSEDSSSRDLRKQLSRILPSYMIPSVFIRLDSLPMTPNGKIDHRALHIKSASHTE